MSQIVYNFNSLEVFKDHLVGYFHDEGNVLPYSKEYGEDALENALTHFKRDIKAVAFSIKQSKLKSYFDELQAGLDELSYLHNHQGLYLRALITTQGSAIKARYKALKKVSGEDLYEGEIVMYLDYGLMLAHTHMERAWHEATAGGVDVAASERFVADLDDWHRLALRHKVMKNALLTANSEVATLRSRWMEHVAPDADMTKPSADPAPALGEPLPLNGAVNMLAELLFRLHRGQVIDLLSVKNLRAVCRNIVLSFPPTKTNAADPSAALYDALNKIKPYLGQNKLAPVLNILGRKKSSEELQDVVPDLD